MAEAGGVCMSVSVLARESVSGARQKYTTPQHSGYEREGHN